MSNRKFLIDTGASVSVFPHSPAKGEFPSNDLKLVSADGSAIKSYGSRTLPVRLGGRHFTWSFVLAAVDRPILGADFLAVNHLMVDISNRQLVDSLTREVITAPPTPAEEEFRAALLTVPTDFQPLLSEFPDVFGSHISHSKPKHKIEHHIVTQGPPVFAKSRRLDPERLEVARREFQAMEEAGIIRVQTVLGHPLFIWCLKQMGPGAHAVITADSTMQQLRIGTHCQTSPSFQLGWLAVLYSPSWIW